MMINKKSTSIETKEDKGIQAMMNELQVQLNYVNSLDIPDDEKEIRENEIMDNFIERHGLGTKFLLVDLGVLITKQLLLLGYSLLYSVIVYFVLDYVIGTKLELSILPKMTIFTFGSVVTYRKIIKILQHFFERLYAEENEEAEQKVTPQTKQDER